MSEVHSRFYYDEAEDKAIIRRVQDVEPILDACKAAHNSGDHGSKDMKFAGSLPMVLIERYCNVNQVSFPEFMRNPEHMRVMLNDPSLAHFRVWPGKI